MNSLLVTVLTLFWSCAAYAYDIGFAYGKFQVPHYMGSTEFTEYPVVYIFSSKDLQFFHKKPGFYVELDYQITLAILGDSPDAIKPPSFGKKPFFNGKNYARRGMGYTPPGLFLGPKFGVRGGWFSFEVTPMGGFALGGDWGHMGQLHRASFNTALWIERKKGIEECICITVDGYMSDGRYNQIYYGVSASEALPDRPQFDAHRSGYLGLSTRLNYIVAEEEIVFMAYLSHQNLTDSPMADSPLVIRKEGLTIGGGVGYLFGR